MSLLFSTGAFASSLSGAAPGMVLLTPTSIAHSGTSASIGANGQVTFTAVTSLSLNGVFTADFDNYVVSILISSGTNNVAFRYRAAGSDNSTASSYVNQRIVADGTSVTAARITDAEGLAAVAPRNVQVASSHWSVYGPALAQPTASRTVSVSDFSSAGIYDVAATHNQSTAYDGFTLFPTAGSSTGYLQVYGVRS